MIKPMAPSSLIRQIRDRNQRLFACFLDFPKPIVAAVNGPAIGAAVTSTCLMDACFASPAATFSLPFAKLGAQRAPAHAQPTHVRRSSARLDPRAARSPPPATPLFLPLSVLPPPQQCLGFLDVSRRLPRPACCLRRRSASRGLLVRHLPRAHGQGGGAPHAR